MSAVILDGKKISEEILGELRSRVEVLRSKYRPPGLAVVLVGQDPASEIYVRNKVKASNQLGIRSFETRLPEEVTTGQLLQIISEFNGDPDVDGILVQTPLPKHVDAAQIFLAVHPGKDVDGFHPFNVGNLVANRPGPRSCTPAGIMELLKRCGVELAGMRAVVVGRSDIVGKPMSLLLLNASATVTICHSRTRDLVGECRRADLLIAALGKPAAITADYIKPGAVVVDVGINRLTEAAEVQRLFGHDPSRIAAFEKNGRTIVGDVEPLAMQTLARAYTPVPGGVGPLTIAMLMANTVQLADQHLG